jgi:anti-anti-sigma factor
LDHEVTVSTGFGAGQALLGVKGDVDLASASRLGDFFDLVAGGRYPSVIVDLTDMASIDAAGLTVILSAASSLVASGGRLTIRSSQSEIAWLLDRSWLAGSISLELTDLNSKRPVSEQVAPGSSKSLRMALPETIQPFSEGTVVPTGEGVVKGALRLVAALARAMVDGADGASVTLRRHDELSTVAATDQTVVDMDSEQYAAEEGPCIDASMTGHWFHAESLDTERRWPTFTPKARALGISAILSSPLLSHDVPVGALNIYSRTATAFAAHEQELAGVFASEASAILTEVGADVTDDQMASRVQRALRIREVIAEAQGVIMERQDVGEKEAFDVLRRSSRQSGKPISQGAREVVDSTHHNQPDLDTGLQGKDRG